MNRVLDRPDPIIRADALTYVRFARRDPEAMRRFLLDFGFVETHEAGFFRCHGDGPAWAVHVAAGGDAFLGFGLAAATPEDFDRFVAATGANVEAMDGPARGRRATLRDPDGISVELVDAVPVAAMSTMPPQTNVNAPGRSGRVNAPVRPDLAAAPVYRMGHVVLQRGDFETTARWYMRHFGLVPSDIQTLPDGTPALGFFRLDRGDRPADHHTLAILGGPHSALLHVSTETSDIDALGQGHQYLRARGWRHHWGIGRHRLGSQLFDYWKDPAGAEWEHYADGDVMDASYPTGYHALERGSLWTWGDDLPDSMRPRPTLRMLWTLLRSSPAQRRAMKAAKQALSVPPRPWLR